MDQRPDSIIPTSPEDDNNPEIASTPKDQEPEMQRPAKVEPGKAELKKIEKDIHETETPIDPEEVLKKYPELTDELYRLFQGIELLSSNKEDLDTCISSQPVKSLSNRIIGDFRIIREIGSGGMSKVFEAEQITMKRKVALKVLLPQFTLSEKSVQKFYREAQAGGKQTHPHIVSIYSTGEYEGIHFIAQELVENGRTLATRIKDKKKTGQLTRGYIRETVEIIANVAEALALSHKAGVIHRDIKPSNILLTPHDFPKVSDFGLAKVEGALALSKTGDFSGTPYYMSPEQAMSRRMGIDHRTDIFSLGATLYEALTLERPFKGNSSHEILKQILFHEPRSPHKYASTIPRDLAVICKKALDKEAKHRFATMEEFAADMRRFLAGDPVNAKAAGCVRKTFKWIQRNKHSASIVFLLLTIAAIIIYSRMDGKTPPTHVPVREALDSKGLHDTSGPGAMLMHVFPSYPYGYFIYALCMMTEPGKIEFNHIIRHINLCIQLARDDTERQGLLKDAYYLLGILNYRQWFTHKSPQLLLEGDQAMDKANSIAETPACLVKHPTDAGQPALESLPWFQKPVMIKKGHLLIHLYKGIWLHQKLFKGGIKNSFDEAVDHLSAVLQPEPDPYNYIIHMLLGRVFYFYALYFNHLTYLDDAKQHLLEALRHRDGKHHYLIHCYMGDVLLMRDDLLGAEKHFQKSLEYKGEIEHGIHNIYSGLGKIYERRGLLDKSREMCETAIESEPGDTGINLLLARLELLSGDHEKALKYTDDGIMRKSGPADAEIPTRIAAPYLMNAKIYLARGDFRKVCANLYKMEHASIQSVRDLSLGCLLIAGFPPEQYAVQEKSMDIRHLADSLAAAAAYYCQSLKSPICSSALGAAALIHGRYQKGILQKGEALLLLEEAIQRLEEAKALRANWPEDIKKYYAPENTRDSYLMAMALFELAQLKPLSGSNKQKAINMFNEAETSYAGMSPAYPYADIIHAIRIKAKNLFEEE